MRTFEQARRGVAAKAASQWRMGERARPPVAWQWLRTCQPLHFGSTVEYGATTWNGTCASTPLRPITHSPHGSGSHGVVSPPWPHRGIPRHAIPLVTVICPRHAIPLVTVICGPEPCWQILSPRPFGSALRAPMCQPPQHSHTWERRRCPLHTRACASLTARAPTRQARRAARGGPGGTCKAPPGNKCLSYSRSRRWARSGPRRQTRAAPAWQWRWRGKGNVRGMALRSQRVMHRAATSSAHASGRTRARRANRAGGMSRTRQC